MNRPLANLVKPLPLSDAIKSAVLHRVGDMGEALSCTLAYEQSQWENVSFKNLSPNFLANTYIQALDWTNGIIGSMGSIAILAQPAYTKLSAWCDDLTTIKRLRD